MTKSVRIENADTSNWPVRVTLQEKNAEGEWVDAPYAHGTKQLDFPTAMETFGIHSHRRLIVEERPADPKPAA